jgi:hypothetical protein
MRKTFLVSGLLALGAFLTAQQALTNGDIIKLVKAGLSDDFIVSSISAQPGNYDASPDAIIALKNAGASDRVMSAVVQKAWAAPVATVPAAPLPVLDSGRPAPTLAPAPAATPAAQPPAASPVPLPPPGQAAQKPGPFHSTDGKLRVYVTDHPTFESNLVVRGDAAAGHKQAGDDRRVVEVEADILKVCPAYIVASNNQDRADWRRYIRNSQFCPA